MSEPLSNESQRPLPPHMVPRKRYHGTMANVSKTVLQKREQRQMISQQMRFILQRQSEPGLSNEEILSLSNTFLHLSEHLEKLRNQGPARHRPPKKAGVNFTKIQREEAKQKALAQGIEHGSEN